MKNIYRDINNLIEYGIKKELISKVDEVYVRNQLLSLFKLDDFNISKDEISFNSLHDILDNMLGYAYEKGLILENTVTYRDMFDTKIMNCLMPRPSEVVNTFNSIFENNKKEATDYFYNLSLSSNYIRTNRISKNIIWKSETKSGLLDITINLSKPEKDPKDIAAARNTKTSNYPKCLLCRENEGYAGRINHPARDNHRIIPLTLDNEEWFMQYSPYVYYNEHSIIFKGKHEPMSIKRDTFKRLLEFTDFLPHYFIGSNADLPIVGGSILSHDHFQGGNYEFAVTKSEVIKEYKIRNYEDIKVGIVKWPMSIIRLNGNQLDDITDLAEYILNKWINYSDETVEIISHSNGQRHNTITPISRKRNGRYELDLVLRNNRTSEEHPLGIFHPHIDIHHIKKENIGLIEVMGLAVLPARLKDEIESLKQCLMGNKDITTDDTLTKHHEWYNYLKEKRYTDKTIDKLLKDELAIKFERCLIDAGVFKQDGKGLDAFDKFISTL